MILIYKFAKPIKSAKPEKIEHKAVQSQIGVDSIHYIDFTEGTYETYEYLTPENNLLWEDIKLLFKFYYDETTGKFTDRLDVVLLTGESGHYCMQNIKLPDAEYDPTNIKLLFEKK